MSRLQELKDYLKTKNICSMIVDIEPTEAVNVATGEEVQIIKSRLLEIDPFEAFPYFYVRGIAQETKEGYVIQLSQGKLSVNIPITKPKELNMLIPYWTTILYTQQLQLAPISTQFRKKLLQGLATIEADYRTKFPETVHTVCEQVDTFGRLYFYLLIDRTFRTGWWDLCRLVMDLATEQEGW